MYNMILKIEETDPSRCNQDFNDFKDCLLDLNNTFYHLLSNQNYDVEQYKKAHNLFTSTYYKNLSIYYLLHTHNHNVDISCFGIHPEYIDLKLLFNNPNKMFYLLPSDDQLKISETFNSIFTLITHTYNGKTVQDSYKSFLFDFFFLFYLKVHMH